jgi:hypothetical protein
MTVSAKVIKILLLCGAVASLRESVGGSRLLVIDISK